MAGHESLDSRDKGFKDRLAAYPDLVIVGNRVANNEEAEGMSLTADMLTKDPDLVGLFADNAQMGTGAGVPVSEQNSARSSASSLSTPTPARSSISTRARSTR